MKSPMQFLIEAIEKRNWSWAVAREPEGEYIAWVGISKYPSEELLGPFAVQRDTYLGALTIAYREAQDRHG